MKKYILSVFLLTAFLLTTGITAQISLEKIWQDYDYIPESVPGFRFMNDGQHYTKKEDNQIVKYDLLTGDKVDLLFNGDLFADTSGFNGQIASYSFSADENYIIIETDREAIYRRSSKAYFFIYNRNTEDFTAIRDGHKVSYATISPDGRFVAYVFENNIYLQGMNNASTIAITEDGSINEIINGAADWVYEEEFSMSQAFDWNVDGSKLAYLRFDERQVAEFTMTNYRNELYPEYITFKYPKVGEVNAIVSVHIYDLKTGQTESPVLSQLEDKYIPRIKWTRSPDVLFAFELNRHQNHLRVFGIDLANGQQEQIIDEINNYYIDITDNIYFLENGDAFVWSSEKSGYNHLYLHDMKGREKCALTSGKFDVTEFYGVDEKNKKIYFQSAEKSPLERQVYSTSLSGKGKKIITDYSGTNNAQFSHTFDYYVNTNSTINQPSSYSVYNRNGEIVRQLENNDALRTKMKSEKVREVSFFQFDNSEGNTLNGYMIQPAAMESGKKYPLLMYVYGGPGSQNVTDAWKGQNYWWFQMLAQQGYVVACVDNRGTGARGEEFKKMTYMQLGHYETIDQTDAARYLGSLDYIDETRIGIFGWSYGGYMSSLCILKSNDIFKAAIAIAPVTNWKWYDTVYTERYMRTEEENQAGYAENAPVNFAERLKGNYLLIHGMGDDNVHFQHTAEMANALINSNKQFETYFYPNRNHGIYGGTTRLHLYSKMTDFLIRNL